MAKLTREQRQAQEALAEKVRTEEFLATWPERLMSLLERASKCGFQLEVENKTFVVTFNDKWNDQVKIKLEHSPVSRYNTEDEADRLMWEVSAFEEARAEAARKAALVSSAKSKLSKEELEALGLK